MDTRIKTFQLSLAIHALVFAVLLWHGKSAPLPDRFITVDLGDIGAQSLERSPDGFVGKKQNAKAVDRPHQDIPAKGQEQTVAPRTPEEEPLVPVEEKPVEADTAGQASPTDNRQAESALSPVNAGSPPLAKVESGGFETTGVKNDADSGKGDSVNTAKELYLKEHFAYIRDAIMKKLSYPTAARRMGWEGKVVVSFVISEDGYVSDIEIVESSGFGVLDRNAVETVKKASPFPKPPVRAELVMPIVYDLR